MPTQGDTHFFVTTCIETLLFLARRPGGGLADMYELMEVRDDLTDTINLLQRYDGDIDKSLQAMARARINAQLSRGEISIALGRCEVSQFNQWRRLHKEVGNISAIYIITPSGQHQLTKIGRSDKVLSRIVTICNNGRANTHNFPEVKIHAIVACKSEMAPQVEATFLRAFALQLAEGNEWFAMREEDIGYIEGLADEE